jgi:phospholipase C
MVKRPVISFVLLLLLALQPGTLSMISASNTATPFKHVIVITQENHSFDNYFGTYPTANGTLVNDVTSTLKSVDGIPSHVCLPYGTGCLSPHPTSSTSPENPVEGQLTYEKDYSSGSGFPDNSGPQSMVYFDYHSIPAYWDYAEEYGLADNYYSAVLSMTTPNRLILLTGDSPVPQNNGPPPFVQYDRTIFSQLADAGVSWGYYDLLNSSQDPAKFYPLNYVAGLDASRGKIQNISSLFEELRSGSGLPSVSYVNFLGDLALTEHPPFSPVVGETRVVSVVNAVMRSAYWNSTAIFITWDEGGGFYDHVRPPEAFSLNHNFTSPLLSLGQSVPLLVISPYSKLDYVSHIQLSHLSLLHFIEFNWNISPLNRLVADSNLPTDFFSFSQSPRRGLLLGATPNQALSYPLPLQTTLGVQTNSDNLPQFAPGLQVSLAIAAVTIIMVAGALLLRQFWPRARRRILNTRNPERR